MDAALVSRLTPIIRKRRNTYRRLPAARVSLSLWHLRLKQLLNQ